MFLERIKKHNQPLIEWCTKWHQEGLIEPDSYVVDVDTVLENGKKILKESKKYNMEVFLMTKQFGRNPYLAKRLIDLGFDGVVAVDYRDARIMMENHIPLGHVGHLVQTPSRLLEPLLRYGVKYITLFSVEKAKEINEICKKLGITQKIILKVYDEGDMIYPSQEGGVPLESLGEVVKALQELEALKICGLTVFPALLYSVDENKVLPTSNIKTLKKANKMISDLTRQPLILNMPSCNQTETVELVQSLGGHQIEPGSALIGMTPNEGAEKPAMIYISEISHHYKNYSICYGGGYYRRGVMNHALIGSDSNDLEEVEVIKPSIENIDYQFMLKERKAVGDSVIMCFRTQVFVTRSQLVLVEGLLTQTPYICGIYDSQGRELQ